VVNTDPDDLIVAIRACTLCADRFAATTSAHLPRPVPWFRPGVRILIAGQAPGMKVYKSGRPFDDRSGQRLRDWMGLSEAQFYDQDRVAVVPMAFCFPGYNARGADLPPPPVCARTWHARVMAHLGDIPLRLIVGGAAQRWHLRARAGVTATTAAWRDQLPGVFPLPHPSWRNTGWIRNNPWFETDLLPVLRAEVQKVLNT
jgi:uracil-DNA glycosylase